MDSCRKWIWSAHLDVPDWRSSRIARSAISLSYYRLEVNGVFGAAVERARQAN